MNLENICRICLRVPNDSSDLTANNDYLLNKINSISSVKIEIGHGLPRKICGVCEKSVNYIYNFQKLIKQSDYDLKSRLQTLTNTNYRIKPRQIEPPAQISTTIECNENEPIVEIISNSKKAKKRKKLNETSTINVNSKTTSTKYHYCSTCDAKFLLKHQLNHHRIMTHRPKRVCTICGGKFLESNYSGHMAMHSPPQTCSICGKLMKNISSLKYHIKRAHGKPKKICPICGKEFVLPNDYKRHYLRHTDPERAYQPKSCTVCGKKYICMKKHMLTHTGEKPHICPYCYKGFQGQYGLKVHIRQHTNERPYVCEHCGDTFTQTVSLKTHFKNKHGISN